MPRKNFAALRHLALFERRFFPPNNSTERDQRRQDRLFVNRALQYCRMEGFPNWWQWLRGPEIKRTGWKYEIDDFKRNQLALSEGIQEIALGITICILGKYPARYYSHIICNFLDFGHYWTEADYLLSCVRRNKEFLESPDLEWQTLSPRLTLWHPDFYPEEDKEDRFNNEILQSEICSETPIESPRKLSRRLCKLIYIMEHHNDGKRCERSKYFRNKTI